MPGQAVFVWPRATPFGAFDAHDFSKSDCAALRSSTESRRAPPNRGCGAVDPGIGECWSFFGRAGKDCFERLESSILIGKPLVGEDRHVSGRPKSKAENLIGVSFHHFAERRAVGQGQHRPVLQQPGRDGQLPGGIARGSCDPSPTPPGGDAIAASRRACGAGNEGPARPGRRAHPWCRAACSSPASSGWGHTNYPPPTAPPNRT